MPVKESDGTDAVAETTLEVAADVDDTYHIKWISWYDEKTAIVLQNRNGPCPLLAIFNVLLLSKRINLPQTLEMISSHQVVDYIGELMYEEVPNDLTEGEKLNYEQNMSDAIAVFSKLHTGIDVNVQFKSVSSFECTSEITVFEVLRIPLYHGWLPDPQDESAYPVLHSYSYNQAVDLIITSKDTTDENVIHKGLIAEQFLNTTASQLTYYGVVKILETMDDRQLGVFFRNNHFSTVYKKGNELFTLVTDQGFLSKPNIVWETLCSVQGDSHFTDSNFLTTPLESPSAEQQIDQDYQVALSLQDQAGSETPSDENIVTNNVDADREYAMSLQQQFDDEINVVEPSSGPSGQARTTPVRATQPTTRQHNTVQDKNGKCCIL